MKLKLPEAINTMQEALDYLKLLVTSGYDYHPDDDAHDIHWAEAEEPTTEEANQMNKLMADIQKLPEVIADEVGQVPYGYMMEEQRKFRLKDSRASFLFIDKSGRGIVNNRMKTLNLLNCPNDLNWDGIGLHEWAEDAEEGDIFENASMQIVCTKNH